MENMTFAQYILYLVISAAVAITAEYIRRRLGTEKLLKLQEELSLKQDLAVVAVKYAEQAWREANGPQKYLQASEWLATALQARGVKTTPEDVRAMIEWALREIKDQLGEEWASTLGKST